MITFAINGRCLPAALALAGRYDLMVDGGAMVFMEQNQTLNLRIEVFILHATLNLSLIPFLRLQWPGYDRWGAQVSILSPRRTIQFNGFLDKTRRLPEGTERDYSCGISEGDR